MKGDEHVQEKIESELYSLLLQNKVEKFESAVNHLKGNVSWKNFGLVQIRGGCVDFPKSETLSILAAGFSK